MTTAPAATDADGPGAPARGAAPLRVLRVVVLVGSSHLPAWMGLVVRQIAESDVTELAAVEVVGGAPDERGGAGFGLYERLDRRLCRSLPDAFEPSEVGAFPSRGTAGAEESLAERVAASSADVVLDLAGHPERDALARLSRYGVWSLHHGDSRRYVGGPPLFWEMHTGDPVSVGELQATYMEAGSLRRRVLYRTYGTTEGLSLQANRNSSYWRTAHLAVRRLRDLRRGGWEHVLSLAAPEEAPVHDPAVNGMPSAGTILRHAVRVARRLVRHRLATKLYTGQWFVAVRRRGGDEVPLAPTGAPFEALRPPAGRFFADPFVLEHEGTRCVFFEDYPLATGKGLISCAQIGDDGRLSAPNVVLEHECHLSYPFVFSLAGEAYMIPETGGARTVELYRARRFPDEWVREQILMRDIVAFDSTLLRHDGRFWLFAVVPVEGGTPWDELSLFWSDSLGGPWTPHPMNPIVSDARRARPAGRILELDGTLVRPGQDCTGRYGRAMTLNRIDVLSTSDYRETTIGRIDPHWTAGIGASHCYDRDERFEVVDGCRRVGRGRWGHLLPGGRWNVDGR